MARKTHDLAVKVGTYQKDGESKGRYENVGVVMANDDGQQYILLKRTFSPAGVMNSDNKESILISMFEPKEKQNDNY